jgi:hypothetical protein
MTSYYRTQRILKITEDGKKILNTAYGKIGGNKFDFVNAISIASNSRVMAVLISVIWKGLASK